MTTWFLGRHATTALHRLIVCAVKVEVEQGLRPVRKEGSLTPGLAVPVTSATARNWSLQCSQRSLNVTTFRVGAGEAGLRFGVLTNFLVSVKDWEGSFHSLATERVLTIKVQ